MYIEVKLSDKSIQGSPIDLPSFLQGLQQESLYDLSWTDPALELNTIGLYPIAYQTPSYDSSKQILDSSYSYEISQDGKEVIATQETRDMTSDETTSYNEAQATEAKSELDSAIAAKVAEIGNMFNTVVNNGATYQGKVFQIDISSRQNLDSASLLASLAITAMTAAGTTVTGNLRWANPNVDFGWIAEDNTILDMDAPSVIKFGQTVAGYYTELIFTTRTLKNDVLALTELSAVNEFDVTKGWPSSTIG